MNKSKKNLFLSRYYTVTTVLSPLLMMYNFGFATITFLDVALICGYVMILLGKQRIETTKLNGLMVFYVSMLILNFGITLLYRDYELVSVLLRIIRLSVYLLWVVAGGLHVFDGEMALKIWQAVCVFASAFLMLQYIALNLFGISIPGYLPFLDVARDELVDFTENLYASSSARPRSIFAEPSQYGIYLTGFLIVAFLKKNYIPNKWVVGFLYLGMLLSASTSAFMGIALSFVFFCVFRLKRKKRFLKRIICYLIFATLFIGILLVFTWPLWGNMIERILTRLPSSLNNRLSGWNIVIKEIQSEGLLEQMLGFGMDAELIDSLDWTSSVLKIWFYYGYIGVVVCLCGLLWFLLQKKKPIIWLVFAILLIGFFTELLVSSWLVLYVPFVQFIAIENAREEAVKCA